MGLQFSMNGTTRDRLISAAHNLCDLLNSQGVPVYIYNTAATGSCYFRIRGCHKCRSIRLSDHRGRVKYRFKYNLFLNEMGYKMEQDGNVWRHYYGIDEVDRLITHLQVEYRNRKGEK